MVLLRIAVIILIAGILGGYGNHLVNSPEKFHYSAINSIFIGVLASALVPLLLNIIQSSIFDHIAESNSEKPSTRDILVFFGFCLIASFTGVPLLTTIKDRYLMSQVVSTLQTQSVKSEKKDSLLYSNDSTLKKAVEVLQKHAINNDSILVNKKVLPKSTDLITTDSVYIQNPQVVSDSI